MTRRIQRVAVIGAGISGVVSAAHLMAHGIDVTVFERNHAAGGVWLHDERKPLEPNYPSINPSVSEKHREDAQQEDSLLLEHAPPGPCYDGLKNNVATSLMRVKLNAWPEGTPEFVSHTVMKEYIQDTSKKAGADSVTLYGARVNRLRKDEQKWHVTWSTLTENDQPGRLEGREESAIFDAVIVASGHYHAPRVPDVPGLSKAKTQWPSRIIHSKGYRKPDTYAGKNVLLIGGGVSSTDLAREIGPLAKNVYQSTRNGEFDISSSILPDNGVRVSEIERFEIESPTVADNEPLPMVIHLRSGQKLCGIDAVIICTGYHITLPFLSEYHDDTTPAEKANETILVTDGTQVHNLHKDIFYIPDPTLAFVGVPYYTATFTLFEFQAIVVANVFAEIAELPSKSDMRDEYNRKIKEKGSGKRFHSLKDVEEFYVLDLLEWINAFREKHGLPVIEGHSDHWHVVKAAQRERVQLLLGAGRRRDSGIGELPALETAVMAPSPATVDDRAVDSSSVVQKNPKRKWVSYLWDTFDKSPEERRLLFKLDTAILTFASLGYFIKYLDQVNINNAFVSGMKEDLGLYGNQLNYMQACWTVGYVIGEIPSNMLLTRIRPRYWIPAMELLWTVLTFILSRSTNATHFYVLRFFIGLAESSFYPGMQYIIGSWYRKDELAKRSCIFHTSSGIASMFSGYLMAGVYNLGGRGGLKGWQWLFMIDGIISIPVAISGFFILPDVPEISNPFYLSEEEVKLAQKRMQFEGRKNREPYTKAKLKKIFSSWRIYLLTIVYIAFNNGAAGSQPVFQQYLKDSTNPKYTVDQINAYPTTTNAVQVVTTLVYAWTSDTILKGRRWPCIIIGACINIICYVSLAIWDIPTGWKWTCYILSGAGFGLSGLCMAWAHEICTEDNEERALVVGSMNEMAYVFQAWLPLVVWQQVDGPQYRKGFITVTIMSVILIISTMATRSMQHRDDGRK
ncbi:pantothenate transporter [Aspergillus sclerotioniger CBS 115572]|uniref:Pantothenate transporter n=1 Tax=Aspergillus sclerotioniger CBS 115572 TaxID=1450535 RepID=A0A317W8M7_9EURO|nr:pantothenate transporter [Aspergillus sclerotioniger CBS 115572]PWY81657.1 pantothenate transporter [Aspergillus sclerotioniger CBS 115572]